MSALEKALRKVSASEMKAARAQVQGELNSLPPRARPSVPPSPPSEEGHPADPPREEGRTVTISDIKDLERTGKIATEFMAGTDQIGDVLMLLVLKFGRASTLIRAGFVGIMIAVLLLAANLFCLLNLLVSQTSLQREQEKIQQQQIRILESQGDTQRAANEAREQATAAQQKAPEVVVDAQGRPQLILRVQNPVAGGKTTRTVEPAARSKLKGKQGTGRTLELPL